MYSNFNFFIFKNRQISQNYKIMIQATYNTSSWDIVSIQYCDYKQYWLSNIMNWKVDLSK